jgi:hypothetical protein
MTEAFQFGGDLEWRPSYDDIAGSTVSAAIREHGIATFGRAPGTTPSLSPGGTELPSPRLVASRLRPVRYPPPVSLLIIFLSMGVVLGSVNLVIRKATAE